jgi:protein-tyrosine phosphatase
LFSIFKKSSPDRTGIFRALRCDVHSHLIPGIDDGAEDMDGSLRLIRGMLALGYERIITTPHINANLFPNTPESIRAGETSVIKRLREEGIGVDFRAAAEYLMDDAFVRLLSEDEPLLTLKDNLVLVELSFAVPAINLRDILFQLQLKGYQPVLAHPERYLYFGANKGWYDQIRDAGCLFQINLLSIIGYYGKESRRLAEYLLKRKYVDFLGSDLHHEQHLQALGSSRRLFETVDRLLETGLIRNPQL